MPASAPLQILIFRHPADTDVAPYEEAVVRAFQGGKEAGGYLATGEDLQIQLQVFSGKPLQSAAQLLDGFDHTFTLVLIDTEFLRNDAGLWDWLGVCWQHTDGSNGRHGMLAVPMEERLGDQFSRKNDALQSLQVSAVQQLGERAIRPALLALRVLHECRLLLAGAVPTNTSPGAPTGFLRLFISHAKIDGLPLAQALKQQIRSIPWLSSFYDADDLPAGSNWKRELEKGVGSSLLVMLRTEVYESRYWCQQEVRWADEYATPAVLVEARTGLNHPGGFLPLDRVPSARIPDGNLLRILYLALREGLRFLLFARRVEAMKRSGELPTPLELRVFSFAPSMPALLRACRSLQAAAPPPTTTQIILYPDPPLGGGYYEAAHALVALYAPGARLVTPNTLTTTTP
jgi:hypothetical protein